MKPIQRSSLLLITALAGTGIVVGRLMPPLVDRAGGSVPDVGWAASGMFVSAALIVSAFAWNTWQAVHKRKRVIHSEHAVRMLAVAKACVTVGSFFSGSYTGYALAYVAIWSTQFGQDRVLHGGAAAIGALLLVVAALLLERACLLPGDDTDSGTPTGAASSPA